MATSSITKNFVVSGQGQVEKFADAIEESYQESLHRIPTSDLRITHLHGSEEIKKFMAKRKKINKRKIAGVGELDFDIHG